MIEILLDTASLSSIEAMIGVYPIAGITCNPTVIRAEGKIDFYPHFRRIREMIGSGTLHIQVLAKDTRGIIDDAHRLLEGVDDQIYIKIPTTEPGLRAMRQLKSEGVHVTATAIYSKTQGMLALATGVDYVAAYFNRMEALDIDATANIASLIQIAKRGKFATTVMAASFKNVAQVCAAAEIGASVTVPPNLLRAALCTPDVIQAVESFADDWKATFGTETLPAL